MEPWTLENGVGKLELFRHNALFEISRGAKAEEAARNICAVYEDNAIVEITQEHGKKMVFSF